MVTSDKVIAICHFLGDKTPKDAPPVEPKSCKVNPTAGCSIVAKVS